MLHIDISSAKIAVYLEKNVRSTYGKTGLAVLRYCTSEIGAVIDTEYAGQSLKEVTGIPRQVPIVASVQEALNLGADTFLIGLATSGGVLTGDHRQVVEIAVAKGMSIINGLHEELAPQFKLTAPNQHIYDVRKPPKECFKIGFGRALDLKNKRVLTVGTDMAIGKMSACLELQKVAVGKKIKAKFFATGQTGIIIDGRGIPLDAVPVDFASGAVEYGVLSLSAEHCDLLLVEGQGSLLNPSSTATLPLLRGSQPTHLVLVHKAGQTHVKGAERFPIPPLSEVVKLYEDISRSAGTFPGAKVAGIALNTVNLSEKEALAIIEEVRKETRLPVVDAVRFSCEELLDAIMNG